MFLRFFHFFGFALWLGGGMAAMAMAIRARRETAAGRAAIFRALAAASTVIGVGATITVLTGIGLIWQLASLGAGRSLGTPGRSLMMGAGMLGALLVYLVAWPTSRTIGRLAQEDPLPPEFEVFRKRMAIVSSVAGGLALLALFGATAL